MFDVNILRKACSNPKTHIAEGNEVAFCFGVAKTKTLNQNSFGGAKNVRYE